MSLSLCSRACIALALCFGATAHASIPAKQDNLKDPPAQTRTQSLNHDAFPWGKQWLPTIGTAYKAVCTGKSPCKFHGEKVEESLESGLIKVTVFVQFYVRADGSYAADAQFVSADWRVSPGEGPVIIVAQVRDELGVGTPNEYRSYGTPVTSSIAQQNLTLMYRIAVALSVERAIALTTAE
jgi:hypothetical protein